MDPGLLKRMLVEKWFALRMAIVDNGHVLDLMDIAAGRDPLVMKATARAQAEAAWAELDARTLTVKDVDVEGEAVWQRGMRKEGKDPDAYDLEIKWRRENAQSFSPA